MVLPYAALAYVVGAETSESAKGLFEVTLVATPVIAFPLALLVGSTAVAVVRTHRLFALGSFALAGVLVVAALSFAASGFFSPDVQWQVVFEGFIVWLVASAVVLGSRTRTVSSLAT